MQAHGVGEGRFEKIVVFRSKGLDDGRKILLVLVQEVCKRAQMGFGKQKSLERPQSPERNNHNKRVVLAHYTGLFFQLQAHIVAKQVRLVRREILTHVLEFVADFGGNHIQAPCSAVRMWVGTAHGQPLVLENSDVLVWRSAQQQSFSRVQVQVLPGVHNSLDGLLLHKRDCKSMVGTEADHKAVAFHAQHSEQSLFGCVFILLLLRIVVWQIQSHCGEVVGEHIGGGVSWVSPVGGTGVTWAQVALGIVLRSGVLLHLFLGTLPGSFRSVGRAEDIGVRKRIVSAMRVVGETEGHFWCWRKRS
ncbi:hypothetical protein EJF18_60007 [Clavispora lusitaniae]|uniref:Uncharacterized protein n=1 Tax=Clavispora lusitaniae TaxID=36911 RepID=A0ACD0WQ20_CLALS|nr:hypothetical protein EJF14_60007 [Clavispora lusitaniae]QFZ35599.1 hypothetical protein EJF16_60007 [Clavispora lusitaniae]QFZ40845.1 hypothetical protein EJF15_60007 [Clavispora lusitaniae]QFZ46526.1 hypothetical protein EJF18_60007 [Clavispora lusitaniae]QFZ52191.1 hypothetical protein EJF17_60007 [Clavispora lusitaniae]